MIFDFFGCVKLFFILTACSLCRCVEVSIPESQYEVARGSDITLPCSFSPARPNYEMFILKWEIVQDNVADTVATFYSNLDRADISPDFEGRTTLNVNPSTRVSELHLTKVTIKDSGNFQCTVLIPGDDEGTPSATTFVLVLVPPSPPQCAIQGQAEYYHDITLTCMSNEGSPKPVYDWKTFSVDSVPRAFPPKTTEKDGILSLFNITRETSGYFICTSANRIGSESCNITLAVMPGGSMSGATAGIIGGVVAAVLLLAILIFCYCRNKKKKAKYAEGAPGEMEFHDQDDEASDGYRDNKTPNSQDKYIDEQHRTSEKAEINKLAEDTESNADSHKYRGSCDRLDDNRDNYRSSRDRLDDSRDNYRSSRDRLDDSRDNYRSSRDRLDDNRDNYRSSRDRLDDNRDNYRSSRDRLDDNRDNYRSSRDRLDDSRDNYRSSRDRLDDNRDQYHGSHDRSGDYHGRHDRHGDYRGSRDRLDNNHRYGSRDHLDYSEREQYD